MKVLLACIGKNENNYIREWVEHYKSIGFTNIVIYDNNDYNGEYFEEVISDYIDSGFVILEDYRGYRGRFDYSNIENCYQDKTFYSQQVDCYNECYNTIAKDYDWVLFCDCDEFLTFEECENVSDFLNNERFKDFNHIMVCWKYYDDNDLICIENDNYSIKRFSRHNEIPIENIFVKSFFRTNIPLLLTSPHGCLDTQNVSFLKSCDAIGNERHHGEILSFDNITIIHSIAWLNHYRFKTIEEYIDKKMKIGWPGDFENVGLKCDFNFFFQRNNTLLNKKINFIKKRLNIE